MGETRIPSYIDSACQLLSLTVFFFQVALIFLVCKQQGATAELPLPIPLTAQALDSAGAYILDTGRVCVLWLGRSLDPEFMSQVHFPSCPRCLTVACPGWRLHSTRKPCLCLVPCNPSWQ